MGDALSVQSLDRRIYTSQTTSYKKKIKWLHFTVERELRLEKSRSPLTCQKGYITSARELTERHPILTNSKRSKMNFRGSYE
jgi:hypothetical protein